MLLKRDLNDLWYFEGSKFKRTKEEMFKHLKERGVKDPEKVMEEVERTGICELGRVNNAESENN